MSSPYEMSDDSPVYVISVAAELSGLHPQTLRSYDRLGLVSPGRSAGRGRRYSLRDVLLLRDVQRLSHEGVNLEGIKRVLALENELELSPSADQLPVLALFHPCGASAATSEYSVTFPAGKSLPARKNLTRC